MKTIIVVLCLFVVGCSPLHITANTLIVADWGQTRYIADSPDFYETNPILGTDPTTGEVNKYFLSSLAVYNTTYYLTPVKHREKVATFVSLFQLGYVYNNYTMGIKCSF